MAFWDSNNGDNTGSPSTDVNNENIPEGRDPEAWRMAEQSALSKLGGWAGVSEEGKQAQIQEAYDQLEENNRKARAWEGKEDEGM